MSLINYLRICLTLISKFEIEGGRKKREREKKESF